MRRLAGGLIALGAVVAVLVVAEVVFGGGDSGKGAAARPAPALPTAVLQPPRVTLSELRGKPAVINFWASWCEPCAKEAPQLARLSRRLEGRARLVGVSWNDSAKSARAFIKRYGWRFPNLSDGDGSVGNRFGISGLPTTFVLGSDGRIAAKLVGPQTVASVMRALHHVG